MKNYSREWSKLTSDPHILDSVQNCHIEFWETPYQNIVPKPTIFNKNETEILDLEIKSLLDKGAIEETQHSEGQFISNFLREKKNGKFCTIINLKDLNYFVKQVHFKMEGIRTVKQLMTEGCYMASLDLKDAYFCVPMAKEHRKYLRFFWKGTLYQFTCLPFGLSSAPRTLTKLLKPVMSTLRQTGLESTTYIDDNWVVGKTSQDCQNNTDKTEAMFVQLGFTVNYEKSHVIPSQRIGFLGFIFDSIKMIIELPHDKISKLHNTIIKLINTTHPTIL